MLSWLEIFDIPSGSFAVPEESEFRQLIRRVRERDQEAAQELVRCYESAILRVVRIHMRDARLRRVLDSADICQSVLASFFVRTALGQYEIESPAQLLNLLTTITRNKLTNQANRLRAQRRDIRRECTIGDQAASLLHPASDPSQQVSAREILENVIDGLDGEERYLAEQRSLGRSWPDLSAELGGTDVSLRKKLTRALHRVMVKLGLDEDGEA
jgi:RNA polymerase sigma-70 factor (ECF subfamily)